jgi:hypothetical protein
MKGRVNWWGVGPVVVVVGVSVGKWGWRVAKMGWDRIDWGVVLSSALGNVMFVVGWVLGWMLADLDKHLISRVKVGGRMVEVLSQWPGAVRNVLTLAAMEILGLWVISSASSPLAGGLVFGLMVRLFSEFLTERDYKKWYWVFARDFDESEHKVFRIGLAMLLVIQLFMLVRG